MAAGTESIVKYGIIGVGMMGREHLVNLYHLRSQGVAVVCIADPHVPSQQLALSVAESFNWPLQVKKKKICLFNDICLKTKYLSVLNLWVLSVKKAGSGCCVDDFPPFFFEGS